MITEAKPYTVLVLRPDYMADSGQPVDWFCAWVEARDTDEAAATGVYQAYMADGQDDYPGSDPGDYLAFAVFDGHLRSLI